MKKTNTMKGKKMSKGMKDNRKKKMMSKAADKMFKNY